MPLLVIITYKKKKKKNSNVYIYVEDIRTVKWRTEGLVTVD